jgi:hypothetical protein
MQHRHNIPPTLVRFRIHMRRDHAAQLVALADALAALKGRDTRLGEALELALKAALAMDREQLLRLSEADTATSHWLQLGPVHRHGGKALTPRQLSN